MIDEKKLLCAFVYSAYGSGKCGVNMDWAEKEKRKESCLAFIEDRGEFPEKEIAGTQAFVESRKQGIRDYIYLGHYAKIKGRIERDSGQSFREAVKIPVMTNLALDCAVNFYEVVSFDGESVLAKHLFSDLEKTLIVLSGLEKPNVGDVVSGHWNYFLEIVNNPDYLEASRNYLDKIRNSIRELN